MRFNFSAVQPVDSYAAVPEGIYEVRIADVRSGNSRDGSERWSFRLEVLGGEFAGKTAGWDSLTWSERGVHRVQHVLEALGLDVTGEIELDINDLVGLTARVQVLMEEWEDALTGRRQVRMRVPYRGYGALDPSNGTGLAVDARGGEGESCVHGREVDAEPGTPF